MTKLRDDQIILKGPTEFTSKNPHPYLFEVYLKQNGKEKLVGDFQARVRDAEKVNREEDNFYKKHFQITEGEVFRIASFDPKRKTNVKGVATLVLKNLLELIEKGENNGCIQILVGELDVLDCFFL